MAFNQNHVHTSTIKILFIGTLLVISSRWDLRAQARPERFTYIRHTVDTSANVEHIDTIRPYLTSGTIPGLSIAALMDSASKFFCQFLLQGNVMVMFGARDFGMISLPFAVSSGQTRLIVDSLPTVLVDYIVSKERYLFVGDTNLEISGQSFHVKHYECWNEVSSKDTLSIPSFKASASFFLSDSPPFLIKEVETTAVNMGAKTDTYRSSVEYTP